MRVRFPCGWPTELVLLRTDLVPPGRGRRCFLHPPIIPPLKRGDFFLFLFLRSSIDDLFLYRRGRLVPYLVCWYLVSPCFVNFAVLPLYQARWHFAAPSSTPF